MSLIAIVGASNVGKSSLFNALVGKNKAIVSEIPGTTRDRHYALYSKDQYHFGLIDTGGLGDDELLLSSKLSQQTHHAINEADVIWFMVDGSADAPTKVDIELSKFLRNKDKPLYLVVNKCDLQKDHAAVFFELGFKNLHEISCRTKVGIDQLIEETLQSIPVEPPSELSSIQVAIVGKPNVGKSSWVNALLKENRLITDSIAGTTRDTIAVQFDYQNQHYTLVDTAGLTRKDKHSKDLDYFTFIRSMRSIHQADVVAFMVDVEQGITHHDRRLMGEIQEIGKPFFIMVNKSDLYENTDIILSELKMMLTHECQIKCTSAKKRQGVKFFFEQIRSLYTKSKIEISTSDINKILLNLVNAHQPPLAQGRRIKLRYIHQFSDQPIGFKIHGKQTKKLPKHYVRYLEKGIVKALGIEGVPIKLIFKNDFNPYVD